MKPVALLLSVLFLIIFFPLLIGIVGGVFGLIMGAIGTVIGVFGAVIGAIFGGVGWLFDFDGFHFGFFHWNIFTIAALVIVILLIARPSPRKR